MSKQLLIDKIPINISPLMLSESLGSNGNMKLKGKLQEAEV